MSLQRKFRRAQSARPKLIGRLNRAVSQVQEFREKIRQCLSQEGTEQSVGVKSVQNALDESDQDNRLGGTLQGGPAKGSAPK